MSSTENQPLEIVKGQNTQKNDIKEINVPIRFNTLKQIKIGPWDEKEEEILLNWVKEKGPCGWTKCAKRIKYRTGKQCREHWNNSLNDSLKKGQWTSEENLLILKLYDKFKSWKKILPVFPGRAENAIKNRFYIQLRKIWLKNPKNDKNEHVSKIRLESLILCFDEALKAAEDDYYEENKNVKKENFNNYLREIEKLVEDTKKGNYIDITSLREKTLEFEEDENLENDSDSISMEDDEDEMKKKIQRMESKLSDINKPNSKIKKVESKSISFKNKEVENTFLGKKSKKIKKEESPHFLYEGKVKKKEPKSKSSQNKKNVSKKKITKNSNSKLDINNKNNFEKPYDVFESRPSNKNIQSRNSKYNNFNSFYGVNLNSKNSLFAKQSFLQKPSYLEKSSFIQKPSNLEKSGFIRGPSFRENYSFLEGPCLNTRQSQRGFNLFAKSSYLGDY